ncbi:unnamed protein product [Fusarium graminearum]|nr:unnamed protein product [Fusarium graminearum]
MTLTRHMKLHIYKSRRRFLSLLWTLEPQVQGLVATKISDSGTCQPPKIGSPSTDREDSPV